MKLTVTVKPNSRTEGVEKSENGTLMVRVNAPPVEGKANERVVEVLAEYLHVPRSRITILRGARGKRKVVEIS
jgi:uncharacterized protein (TIGR00251 family)